MALKQVGWVPKWALTFEQVVLPSGVPLSGLLAQLRPRLNYLAACSNDTRRSSPCSHANAEHQLARTSVPYPLPLQDL